MKAPKLLPRSLYERQVAILKLMGGPSQTLQEFQRLDEKLQSLNRSIGAIRAHHGKART